MTATVYSKSYGQKSEFFMYHIIFSVEGDCEAIENLFHDGFAVITLVSMAEGVFGPLTIIMYASYLIIACIGIFKANTIEMSLFYGFR